MKSDTHMKTLQQYEVGEPILWDKRGRIHRTIHGVLALPSDARFSKHFEDTEPNAIQSAIDWMEGGAL